MWEKMTYEEAFRKAEKSTLGWYTDWRVSNIKELYSLIQFTGTVSWEKALTMFIDEDYFNQPLWDTSNWEREKSLSSMRVVFISGAGCPTSNFTSSDPLQEKRKGNSSRSSFFTLQRN